MVEHAHKRCFFCVFISLRHLRLRPRARHGYPGGLEPVRPRGLVQPAIRGSAASATALSQLRDGWSLPVAMSCAPPTTC